MTRWGFVIIVGLQVLCTIFFVSDILLTLIGIRSVPLTWQTRELLEIGAALGLLLGAVLGISVLRRARTRTRTVEAQLRVAAGAFADVLEDRFTGWGLTPAERDVALFLIKGLSTSEIAGLRRTSEGTVKAQTNAIYRKSGVNSRSQLLSLFIDDLMHDPLLPDSAQGNGP